MEIVAARGKMHNPETESGGVLLGTVTAVGERYESPPAIGERIVTLGSLTLTPLRLDAVDALDPDSPRSRSQAPRTSSSGRPGRRVPEDLPVDAALDDLRRLRRRLADPRRWRPAAARCACWGPGTRASWRSPRPATRWRAGHRRRGRRRRGRRRRLAPGLCDIGVDADLRDPLARPRRGAGGGAPPADLTVVVVNAAGCEPTAILLTADGARCSSSRWRRASRRPRWPPTGSARASA